MIPVCKSAALSVSCYLIYIVCVCCFSPLGSDDEDDKNNDESNENNDESNENDMPKLTSINDFFDDEAELSESDWSSDDENNDTDKLDKLDEEAGDKDVLDEKLIKDGLDKIYMYVLFI